MSVIPKYVLYQQGYAHFHHDYVSYETFLYCLVCTFVRITLFKAVYVEELHFQEAVPSMDLRDDTLHLFSRENKWGDRKCIL